MLKIQVMGKARVWRDLTNATGKLIIFKDRAAALLGIEHEKEIDRKPPRNKLQYRIVEGLIRLKEGTYESL